MSFKPDKYDRLNNNYLEPVVTPVKSKSLSSKPPRTPRSKKRASLEDTFQSIKADAVISLSGKNLTKFSRHDVEKYKKCQGFDLSHNRISFTNQLCLDLRHIKYLSLSHNSLQSLPQDLYLMENLTLFDVSENQIQRLPMNIYRMTRLKVLDVRGNPFLKTWNSRKGIYCNHTFDPELFTREIKGFMMAVKEWRDFNVRLQAEEYLEYLLICPAIPPALDDAEYDMTTADFKNCPFYQLMQTRPDHVKRLIGFLDANPPPTYTWIEEYLFNNGNVFGTTTWILREGFWRLLVIFLLTVAFYDGDQFRNVMKWLPNFISAFLIPVHEKLQSYCALFPILPPVLKK